MFFFADHISWYAVTEFLGILLEWYPNFPSSPVQIKYFNYIYMYTVYVLGWSTLQYASGIREKFHFGGSPVALKNVKIVILRDDDWITRGWGLTRILKAPRKLYVDNPMLRIGPKTWHALYR